MAFLMKRHDLRPYIPVQFFQPDGETPLDLSAAQEMTMIVRVQGAPSNATPKFKKDLSPVDLESGKCEYQWTGNDTDSTGRFNYEFEIVWPTGEPQTFPADTYFELIVADDLG